MRKFVLASANQNKIAEMRTILAPLRIELVAAIDFPELEEVIEDQPTLQGNALKKAVYTARQTGLPAIADDTGLEVEALNGAPGVYSARYAGLLASYDDNVQKLLSELQDKRDRAARFRTVIALVIGNEEHVFEGVCEGEITKARQGTKGFGYDPVFRPAGYEKTFAELESYEKNKISHRGRAMRELMRFLEKTITAEDRM